MDKYGQQSKNKYFPDDLLSPGEVIADYLEHYGMTWKVRKISDIAENAGQPVAFGERCAAFINTDLRNALQHGAKQSDVIAGLVYSIADNYISRIVGTRTCLKENGESLPSHLHQYFFAFFVLTLIFLIPVNAFAPSGLEAIGSGAALVFILYLLFTGMEIVLFLIYHGSQKKKTDSASSIVPVFYVYTVVYVILSIILYPIALVVWLFVIVALVVLAFLTAWVRIHYSDRYNSIPGLILRTVCDAVVVASSSSFAFLIIWKIDKLGSLKPDEFTYYVELPIFIILLSVLFAKNRLANPLSKAVRLFTNFTVTGLLAYLCYTIFTVRYL